MRVHSLKCLVVRPALVPLSRNCVCNAAPCPCEGQYTALYLHLPFWLKKQLVYTQRVPRPPSHAQQHSEQSKFSRHSTALKPGTHTRAYCINLFLPASQVRAASPPRSETKLGPKNQKRALSPNRDVPNLQNTTGHTLSPPQSSSVHTPSAQLAHTARPLPCVTFTAADEQAEQAHELSDHLGVRPRAGEG
ncbi:hypothetical protein SRHO_G00111120 [Serrasalmus rhombeus]